MPDSHADFLASWVQHTKQIVTYRLMSRERRIHVDEAKESMLAFYQQSKSSSSAVGPHATFIIMGELKQSQSVVKPNYDTQESTSIESDEKMMDASPSSRPAASSFLRYRVGHRKDATQVIKKGILLVEASGLEAAKAKFSKITSCHIYSLQPGPLKDPAVLSNIQHDLHTNKKYIDAWNETGRGKQLGVITSPSIKDNFDPTKDLPSLSPGSAPVLAKEKESFTASDTSKIKSEATTTLSKKPVTTETTTTLSTKPGTTETKSSLSTSKKGGLDWSRAKPKSSMVPSASSASVKRKASEESSDSQGDSKRTKSVSTGSGRSKAVNTRRSLLGDESDGSEEEGGDKIGYDVDENDNVVTADPPLQNSSKAPKSSTTTAKKADAKKLTKQDEDEQRKALEDMMELEDDPEILPSNQAVPSVIKDTEKENPVKQEEAAQEPKPKKRVTKQRKVTKKVRRKDERGYTITETVDTYESYSSEESDTPTKTAAVTSKSKSKPKPKQPAASAVNNSVSAGQRDSPEPPMPAAVQSSGPPSSSNLGGGIKKETAKKPPTSSVLKKGQQSLATFFSVKSKSSK